MRLLGCPIIGLNASGCVPQLDAAAGDCRLGRLWSVVVKTSLHHSFVEASRAHLFIGAFCLLASASVGVAAILTLKLGLPKRKLAKVCDYPVGLTKAVLTGVNRVPSFPGFWKLVG